MYKPYDTFLDKFMYYFGLVLLFGGLISLFFIEKYNIDVTNLPTKCTLYEYTGFYCPGCGGTRSVVFLLNGQLLKSIYYHPTVVYVFFPWLWFLLTQTIYKLSKRIRKYNDPLSNNTNKTTIFTRLLKPITIRPAYIYIGLIIFAVQCLLKNIAYICGYPPF